MYAWIEMWVTLGECGERSWAQFILWWEEMFLEFMQKLIKEKRVLWRMKRAEFFQMQFEKHAQFVKCKLLLLYLAERNNCAIAESSFDSIILWK